MKDQNRFPLAKEVVYYGLGILLILGFVYLYWGHFTDKPGPPDAIRYIMSHWGMRVAIMINAAVFLLFILFLPFRDRIEWRSKGMLSAFILALFAEMFGVPLLIFLLQPLGADNQIWDAVGLGGIKRLVWYFSKHWPTRAVGVWMTLGGMLLVFFGWMKIHKASGLVTDGIYRYMRHPQYTGIFLIITGWMFRWLNPTILIMYPILLILYYRLARREEQQVLAEYGAAYLKYKEETPMFVPIEIFSKRRKTNFRKEKPMSTTQTTSKLSAEDLREEVRKEYADVAVDPHKGYHFHTGRAATDRLGYDPSIFADVPEENIASFAGTGNPFMLGPINPGEIVVDVGSGAGLDALIASTLVGPEGKVIGVDMTQEMLDRARTGADAMGAVHVEFREGIAENLPMLDKYADVVISNGVLNLTLDKVKTLSEWARVLKPGGRLYIGDILVAKSIPPEALDDISLWTG